MLVAQCIIVQLMCAYQSTKAKAIRERLYMSCIHNMLTTNKGMCGILGVLWIRAARPEWCSWLLRQFLIGMAIAQSNCVINHSQAASDMYSVLYSHCRVNGVGATV